MSEWREVLERQGRWWHKVAPKTIGRELRGYHEKVLRLGLARRWKGRVIVDVGAGPLGGCLGVLGQREANTLVSVDPQRYDGFPREPGIEYVRARMEALPFARDSIDVAICTCTLDYVEDYEAGLDEVARVLKRWGRFHLHVYLERRVDCCRRFCEDDARRFGDHFRKVRLAETVRDRVGRLDFYGVYQQ